MNISSLEYHIGDLRYLVESCSNKPKIIGITECRLRKNKEVLSNIDLNDYSFEFSAAESTTGGTLIHIENDLRYKICKDLNQYREKETESTFVAIIYPNLRNKNKIIGCIYKHPNVPVAEFTSDFITPLLEKLSCDKKEIILMGDFNINVLKCDSDKDTTDFIDTMYTSSLYPTINTPTRITTTSKTLIDNIFYNDFTKKISTGNILTSISDHLTQYLLISNQTEVSQNNSKKETPKIRKFNMKCFLEEFRKIDWENYLKIYKKDTDLSFELFLRKIKFLYNKNSPLKRKIKRDTSKPWMTSGILKSISVKNKLYKQFCKATNSTRKDTLHQKYKNYKNQIATLNRLCKENYFKIYFETNKKTRYEYGMV